jgi:hypothetical protein
MFFLIFLVLRALQVDPFGAITSMLASLFHPSYTAQVPGPGCDQGAKANMWGAGGMHHEHGVDVNDPHTSFSCESDGLLITRTGSYNVYGDAFFGNAENESLPTSYRVQVTAQIIHGDNNATVDLCVHGQSKYGADCIEVSSNGQWSVVPFDDSTGQQKALMDSGTLAQNSTIITILAEVHGPSITVTINGDQVTTVSDPGYSTSSFLSFGIADPNATRNPSALFSNFVYTPL